MQLLDHQDLQTMTHAVEGHPRPEQTSNDERRGKDLQMQAAPIAKNSSVAARTVIFPVRAKRKSRPGAKWLGAVNVLVKPRKSKYLGMLG
jgi:hypothetical protein